MAKGYTDQEKENRMKWVGKECTLDGLPAIIRMDGMGYPRVRQTVEPCHEIACSWTKVWNVLENREGRFFINID